MTELQSGCTDACYEMPDCAKCGKPKAPRGRSVPTVLYRGYCVPGWPDEPDYCAGYDEDPKPGHNWPEQKPGHPRYIDD